MKLFTIIALALFGSVAFADQIDLQPGSTIVIHGDRITCLASEVDESAPVCKIQKSGGFYDVYAGDLHANRYNYFNDAIEAVKQMREAGLCR